MKLMKMYEEYINSPSNRISTLLKNIVTMLNNSFGGVNGGLGSKDLETISLIDIEQSDYADAFEKNILMRFSDDRFQYQMIFVIKLEDIVENDEISKGYIKIKIYDGNDAKMLREWQSNVEIKASTTEEENKEGRFFVKIGEISNDAQSSENLDYFEDFIIQKIGFLKESIE